MNFRFYRICFSFYLTKRAIMVAEGNGSNSHSDKIPDKAIIIEREGKSEVRFKDVGDSKSPQKSSIDSGDEKNECGVCNDDTDNDDVPEVEEVLLDIEKQQEDVSEWIPDGGYGWFVVIGGIMIHVFIGGLMKASGVMYIKLKDAFNQSAVATAWVFSLFTTCLLMFGPIASALCHRFSCRTVVFVGSILCFIGLLLSAFAPNIEFLYFSYCIVGGFGRCLTYTPSLIVVTNYFNKRRGLAVGLTTSGVGLGMFVFPPMIEALFSEYGYQGAMLLMAAISLQTFVCAALFRPLELHKKIVKTTRLNRIVNYARRGSVDARKYVASLIQPKQRRNIMEEQDRWHGSNTFSSTTEFTFVVPEPTMKRRKSVIQTKISKLTNIFKPEKDPTAEKKPLFELHLLKDFPFLALCLAIMLFTMSMMSVFVFLPPLAKSRGLSQIESAYLISIIGAVDSCARFLSGFILDLKKVKPYRIYVYNGVMFGVAIVSMIMPSIHGFAGFAIISACYGLFTGTYVAQKSVVVVDYLGLKKMTSSFGLLLGFQGIGSLVGPTVSGLFRDVFGTYDEAFYFGGIGIFFGGFVLMIGNIYKFFRDRKRRRKLKAAGGENPDDKTVNVCKDDDNNDDNT